jgi:hypothetical protein
LPPPPPPRVVGGYSGFSEFYLDYKGMALSDFIGLIEKPGATSAIFACFYYSRLLFGFSDEFPEA